MGLPTSITKSRDSHRITQCRINRGLCHEPTLLDGACEYLIKDTGGAQFAG